MISQDNNGHWENISKHNNVKDFYGFVYIITNLTNGKKYIGCKQTRIKRNKKMVDSNWKTYTGSNTKLNIDIKSFGKHKFLFTILEVCNTKSELKYTEALYIMKNNAIFDKTYYNEYIQLRLRNRK